MPDTNYDQYDSITFLYNEDGVIQGIVCDPIARSSISELAQTVEETRIDAQESMKPILFTSMDGSDTWDSSRMYVNNIPGDQNRGKVYTFSVVDGTPGWYPSFDYGSIDAVADIGALSQDIADIKAFLWYLVNYSVFHTKLPDELPITLENPNA